MDNLIEVQWDEDGGVLVVYNRELVGAPKNLRNKILNDVVSELLDAQDWSDDFIKAVKATKEGME